MTTPDPSANQPPEKGAEPGEAAAGAAEGAGDAGGVPTEGAPAEGGSAGAGAASAPPSRVRRVARRLLRWSVMALPVVLILIGPWPVIDYENEGSAWEAASIASIDAAIIEADGRRAGLPGGPGEPAPLRAGYAEAELLPPGEVPLAGYGKRFTQGKTWAEGHDDVLRVRVLALAAGEAPPVFIVAADLLIVSRLVAREVMEQLAADAAAATLPPIDRSAVYFTATHTHCGPGAFGTTFLESLFLGPHSEQTRAYLVHQIASAIRRAHAGLGEVGAAAEITGGSVAVPDFVRNRLDENEPVDDVATFMAVRRLDESLDVTLVTYAAHATVQSPDVPHLDADYPGYLCRALEGADEEDLPERAASPRRAMFCAGGVGSHGPRASGLFTDGRERARAIGRGVAEQIGATRDLISWDQWEKQVEIRALGAPITMPPQQMRVPQLLTGVRFSSCVPWALSVDRGGFVQALRVGRQVLFGAPCDLSGEIAARIRGRARELGGRELNPHVTSFSGDYVGYVIPDRLYDRGHYENMMSFHGPFTGSYMEGLAAHALTRLLEEPPK